MQLLNCTYHSRSAAKKHANPCSAKHHAGSNVPETTKSNNLKHLSNAQRRPRPFLEWKKVKCSQSVTQKEKAQPKRGQEARQSVFGKASRRQQRT
jgi:hypothetical protein